MTDGGTFTLRRRFKTADWNQVSGGYQLMLDGNALMSPGGTAVVVPSEALAIAMTAEWQAQGEAIVPASMPLSQLAITAIDRTATMRAAIIAELLKYLETELICHYGQDEDLVAKQRALWQPLHSWVINRFTVVLPVTFGINPIRAILPRDIFAAHLEKYDAFRLAALSDAVAVSGSFIIGLALVEGEIDANTALEAAEVENDYQIARWGSDPATESRCAGIARDLAAVSRFVGLLA